MRPTFMGVPVAVVPGVEAPLPEVLELLVDFGELALALELQPAIVIPTTIATAPRYVFFIGFVSPERGGPRLSVPPAARLVHPAH